MERGRNVPEKTESSMPKISGLINPEPGVIDLNAVVSGMRDVLRRTLGEDVKIEILLADRPWSVRIDPHQLEKGLLSLARDAHETMPEGGRLMIETANTVLDDDDTSGHVEVSPGEYVMLAMTDSGTCMPREVPEKGWQSFFVTEEICDGTGRGLATVHDIVRQAGGHVRISRKVDMGTRVSLYLPRAKSEAPDAR